MGILIRKIVDVADGEKHKLGAAFPFSKLGLKTLSEYLDDPHYTVHGDKKEITQQLIEEQRRAKKS